jgi:hypothetical protein
MKSIYLFLFLYFSTLTYAQKSTYLPANAAVEEPVYSGLVLSSTRSTIKEARKNPWARHGTTIVDAFAQTKTAEVTRTVYRTRIAVNHPISSYAYPKRSSQVLVLTLDRPIQPNSQVTLTLTGFYGNRPTFDVYAP